MANIRISEYRNGKIYESFIDSTFKGGNRISFNVTFENNVRYRTTAWRDWVNFKVDRPTGATYSAYRDAIYGFCNSYVDTVNNFPSKVINMYGCFENSQIRNISKIPNSVIDMSFTFSNSKIINIGEGQIIPDSVTDVSYTFYNTPYNTNIYFGNNVYSMTETFARSNFNSYISTGIPITSADGTFESSQYNQRPYFLEKDKEDIVLRATFFNTPYNQLFSLKRNMIGGQSLFSQCYFLNSPIEIQNFKASSFIPLNHMFYNCYNFNQSTSFFNNYMNTAYEAEYILSSCRSYNQETWFFPATSLAWGMQYCTNFNQKVYFRQPEINSKKAYCNLYSFMLGCYNFNQEIDVPFYANDLNRTFMSCTNLNKYVNINLDTKISFLTETFRNCTQFNQYVNIPNTVTDMYATFESCSSFDRYLDIPETVVNMPLVFAYCSNLTSPPKIPSNIINLSETFSYCRNLTHLNRPLTESQQGLRDITGAFRGSGIANLQDIQVSQFMGISQTKYALASTNIYSPSYFFLKKVTDGLDHLYDNGLLGNIYSVAPNITYLGNVFYNARGIDSSVENYISVPGSITTFNGTFGRVKAPNVTIQLQEGASIIGNYTFRDSSLKVSLPNSITQVADDALDGIRIACYEGSLETPRWGLPRNENIKKITTFAQEYQNNNSTTWAAALNWAKNNKIFYYAENNFLSNMNRYLRQGLSNTEAFEKAKEELSQDNIIYNYIINYQGEISLSNITNYLKQYAGNQKEDILLYSFLNVNLSKAELDVLGIGPHEWDEGTEYTREDLCYEEGGTYVKCKRCGARKWKTRSGKMGSHKYVGDYCYYCGFFLRLEDYYIYTIQDGYAVITGIHYDLWDRDFGERSLITFPKQLRGDDNRYYPTLIYSK